MYTLNILQHLLQGFKVSLFILWTIGTIQSAVACSKSTIEILEQGVKYVQS